VLSPNAATMAAALRGLSTADCLEALLNDTFTLSGFTTPGEQD
jgi:hypothetical protein